MRTQQAYVFKIAGVYPAPGDTRSGWFKACRFCFASFDPHRKKASDIPRSPLGLCGIRADNEFAARVVEVIRGGVDSERRVHPCGKRPSPTGRDMHLNTAQADPFANKLLAGLPSSKLKILVPHLSVGSFGQGVVLTEAGDKVEHVHFPLSGMISIVVVMKDGKTVETATVGRDGVFGAMAGFGPYVSRVRAIVQVPMKALRITASQFRKATQDSRDLQNLCINHNEILLVQARVTAACNALHKVEARFCRWLLQTRDSIDSDTITLTQEFLSEMLGVRRTSVTDVATKMQSAGVISYSRGVIKIIDLAALQALSCECYDTLRDQRAV